MRTNEYRDAYAAQHRNQFAEGGIFLGQCGCSHWADKHCTHCGHCDAPGCECEGFTGT